MANDESDATESVDKETGTASGQDAELPSLDQLLVQTIGGEDGSVLPSSEEEAEPEVADIEEPSETEEEDQVLSQDEEKSDGSPDWYQKRIDRFTRRLRTAEEERDNLADRVEELQAKATAPQPIQPGANPLGNINSNKELDDLVTLEEARLDFVEDQKDMLLDDGLDQVIENLKAQGLQIEDDISENEVRKEIRNIERNSSKNLSRNIPRRKTELQHKEQFDAHAEQLYPWLADDKSAEMEVFGEVVKASPALASVPTSRLEIARYVTGVMIEQQRGKHKATAKAKPKKQPISPGKPKAAPAATDDAGNYETSKERLFSDPSKDSLDDMLVNAGVLQ